MKSHFMCDTGGGGGAGEGVQPILPGLVITVVMANAGIKIKKYGLTTIFFGRLNK